jgi:hypothetical protein
VRASAGWRPAGAVPPSTRPRSSRSFWRGSRRPRPRICSWASLPPTTRRSTGSTTSAHSSSRWTSSPRCSTTPPSSEPWRPRMPSTTCSRWEAGRSWRSPSPRFPRSCPWRRCGRSSTRPRTRWLRRAPSLRGATPSATTRRSTASPSSGARARRPCGGRTAPDRGTRSSSRSVSGPGSSSRARKRISSATRSSRKRQPR